MKVVVTGPGGFLGRNLLPHLAASGHEVVPVSLRNAGWHASIPSDADALVHLAGLAHDMGGKATSADYFRVNTALTREVLDIFQASAIRKLIFVSSVKAVVDEPGETVVDEETVPGPVTAYGRSKLEAERCLGGGLSGREGVYILRPAMIHGPGNKGNLNSLYSLVSSGIPYPLGAFGNARSFLSVANFNHVVEILCARNIPSGTYHLADDETLSTLEVVRLMADILGKPCRVWSPPRWAVRAAALAGDALGLPFGMEKLGKLTGSYRVDNRRIKEAIGGALPLSSREGLRRTIKAFARAGFPR